MAQPLISVIIPTYKRRYLVLERAIKSVIAQTFKNIEIIIVDDSPDDYSYREEIKFNIQLLNDERIYYHQHKQTMGACAARNTGVQYSKGTYLAFLDDDDEWLPKKLEKQFDRAKETGATLITCSSYIIKFRQNDIRSKRIRRIKRISGYVFDHLILSNFIGSTSYVFLERRVFVSCGGFDVHMKASQDYDLWLRISKEFKINYVDCPLVNYFLHEDERISKNMNNKIQGLNRLIEKNLEYLETHPKAMSKKLLELMMFYIEKSEYTYAIELLKKAVKIYPLSVINIRIFMKSFLILFGIYKF